MSASLTVIILTLNEEVNLPYCLQSVVGWATDVFVLDSGSTDHTVAIAQASGAQVFHRPFDTYAAQRTYAVTQLPVQTEWVLFLDADELLHNAIKAEIDHIVQANQPINGYLIRLHFYFMNRWIRHGGYANPQKLVLFRRKHLLRIERLMNELVIVDGQTATLNSYIIHQDRRPVTFWYQKHVTYSRLQANELRQDQQIPIRHITWREANNKRDRRRWVKEQIWVRLPIWVRPFLYFFQRYILLLGFLDGRAGFIYHFSHAFLYQFMIAAIHETQDTHLLPMKAVDFHSDIAEAFGERYQVSPDFRERYQVWTNLIDRYIQTGQYVLDAGCGTGIFSHYIANRGCSVLGIDGSAEMIRLCSQQTHSNAQFQVALLPAKQLLTTQKVDAVVCSSVLEYIPDLAGAMQTFEQHLQPGGHLILSLPNRLSLYRLLERYSFWLTGKPAYLKHVLHYSTADSIKDQLVPKEYTLLATQTFGGTNTVARLLRTCLPARYADTLLIAVFQKK